MVHQLVREGSATLTQERVADQLRCAAHVVAGHHPHAPFHVTRAHAAVSATVMYRLYVRQAPALAGTCQSRTRWHMPTATVARPWFAASTQATMQRVKRGATAANLAHKHVRVEMSNGAFNSCLTHAVCHWYQGSPAAARAAAAVRPVSSRTRTRLLLLAAGRARQTPQVAATPVQCSGAEQPQEHYVGVWLQWRAVRRPRCRAPCVPRCNRERR